MANGGPPSADESVYGGGMSRLCISIPVHEELPVVIDQVENFRAFLEDGTVLVLHIAEDFVDGRVLAAMLPDGVFVNPESLPTRWGSVTRQHESNFRYMRKVIDFDHFAMHASNDGLFAPGMERYIRSADMGVQRYPIDPEPRRDDLDAMVASEGIARICNSQIEGTFYRSELFAAMLDLIDRYRVNDALGMSAPEEWWYPTAAAKFTDAVRVPPTTYTETHWDMFRTKASVPLVAALRSRRYIEDMVGDLRDAYGALSDPSLYVECDFDNLYAIKRVPRRYDDPLRTYLRTLSRERRPRMALRSPVPLRSFVVTATLDEVLRDQRVLAGFGGHFGRTDDVTLLIYSPSMDDRTERALRDVAAAAGVDGDDGPDIQVLVAPPTEATELLLSRIADVMCSVLPPDGHLAELLHVPPHLASRLRAISDRVGATSRVEAVS